MQNRLKKKTLSLVFVTWKKKIIFFLLKWMQKDAANSHCRLRAEAAPDMNQQFDEFQHDLSFFDIIWKDPY